MSEANPKELTGNLRGRDFSGQDLAGVVFRGADLYRADFRHARLQGASFVDCFAAEAWFTRAEMADVRALRSSFYGADFTEAILRDSVFQQCVLAGADLRGAVLDRLTATLDCNSFEKVKLDRAQGAKLAFLISRPESPQREKLLAAVAARDRAWLESVFAR